MNGQVGKNYVTSQKNNFGKDIEVRCFVITRSSLIFCIIIVTQLQRDLQDLREAHAKLRQINEKLRREKDRTEVEREAMRDKYLGGSRESLNQQAKVERINDEVRKFPFYICPSGTYVLYNCLLLILKFECNISNEII